MDYVDMSDRELLLVATAAALGATMSATATRLRFRAIVKKHFPESSHRGVFSFLTASAAITEYAERISESMQDMMETEEGDESEDDNPRNVGFL